METAATQSAAHPNSSSIESKNKLYKPILDLAATTDKAKRKSVSLVNEKVSTTHPIHPSDSIQLL